MKTKKKENLFALIMLIGAMCVLGQNEITIKGKFLLPSSDGKAKMYTAVMIVTPSNQPPVVSIECDENIFQVFNDFDAPRYRRLDIKSGDFYKIMIEENTKRIFFYSNNRFHYRYRNLFFFVHEPRDILMQLPKSELICFSYSNPLDMKTKKIISFFAGCSSAQIVFR